ncbi:uncharacterized protein C1orf131 homolog [Elgaria multicarinata webbii]|uniref:uncharacterized protein C1orf131 homolog n=1 Tax=Elgaria multicarinata webbii TaxID=159646 RepID=UPI002FCCCDB8
MERTNGEEDSSMARNPGAKPVSEAAAERESFASANRLLDTVLSSLYDFGESLPDGKKKKKTKKRNSQEKVAIMASNTLSEHKNVTPESSGVTPGKRKNAFNFFDSLKDDCSNQKKTITESYPTDAAPPKPAQQGYTTEIEVVTFFGRHQKKKVKLEMAEDGCSRAKNTDQEKHMDGQKFNLEKARLEVHRLGITGFGKKEQRVLEQERAIMLGAKPPKKVYLNYKILQEKIKEKKEAKKEENVMENKSDSLKRRKRKGHEERKSKKKTTKQSVLPTGQVGTFKNGTLILRSSDIKKIKSSKVIK